MLQLYCPGAADGTLLDKYGKRTDDTSHGLPQISFPLHWAGYPKETKSFALLFVDFDNVKDEGVSWIHWLVANIPENVNSLDEDFSRKMYLADNTIVQGKNTWISMMDHEIDVCNRYGGPIPLSSDHTYDIILYALDKHLDLKNGFYYPDFRNQAKGSVLDEAVLCVKYKK